MKTLKVLSTAGLVGIFLVLPLVGFAQTGRTSLPGATLTSVGDFVALITKVLNFAFAILLILAVAFVLIAAFKYLTSGGDPEKIKSANGTLIWALVAVAVAILAFSIVRVLVNTVQG
ncbi:MAG: hypothetical protein COU08_00820 [Candidatus Harrisonbacteria bacterium CG10_big_fil_rev_8_21_14_0_10_42_17]|uniref:DUF2976 domain-containing protein n=1 Tax=Candidatus Harrisonbacteria bacterium CG10_big_fil_rev_8_21_14_0_10_42_17 TaxID=1974584 RepID=A0A2M6WIR3_9BACT|nr:MAG: hypothetical protein COU08_00820 [Candidatus Harrisonbacteria bacterium CG10_big_fil_rev_8_21_14_0_10_42_17]